MNSGQARSAHGADRAGPPPHVMVAADGGAARPLHAREYATLDRAGRVQLPREMTRRLGMRNRSNCRRRPTTSASGRNRPPISNGSSRRLRWLSAVELAVDLSRARCWRWGYGLIREVGQRRGPPFHGRRVAAGHGFVSSRFVPWLVVR
jgi:hypothetical protein